MKNIYLGEILQDYIDIVKCVCVCVCTFNLCKKTKTVNIF